MRIISKHQGLILAVLVALAETTRASEQLDKQVERLMSKGQVPGLALALIEDGQPVYMKAYGLRQVEGKLPLETETVMYGASLTKLVFAYTIMQFADEKLIDLDRPLAEYLPKPLPEFPKYADLANDGRWKQLTARMVLDHTTGFPNFRFLNPDGKLDFKFDPGSRYAYSGEGFNLLQFVLEEGLALNLGQEMQRRVFDRFGMTRTSMSWRDDFKPNLADGYAIDGKVERHHARENVRAAGSMDTTIADYAKFLAAFLRGDGLSEAARTEMLRPQIEITSAHQFPTLENLSEPSNHLIKLSAALGCLRFEGTNGPTFFKGGHDDWTDNFAIFLPAKRRGLVLLSNSSRAETIYPALIKAILGETGLPWSWEYNNPPELAPISDDEASSADVSKPKFDPSRPEK